MGLVVILVFLLVLGGVGYGALTSVKRKQLAGQRSALQGVARLLTPVTFVNDVTVAGTLDGHQVTATFCSPHSDSTSVPWTEVLVRSVGTSIDLVMRDDNVVEKMLREKGGGVDVIVGDEAFDAALIIDGAPAEDIRHVFADAELRATLLELRPFELSIKDGDILLRKNDWINYDPLRKCMQSACKIATAAAAAAKLLPASGLDTPVHPGPIVPYRAHEPLRHEGAEMVLLQAARARRERLTKRIGVAVTVLFILGSAAVTLLK